MTLVGRHAKSEREHRESRIECGLVDGVMIWECGHKWPFCAGLPCMLRAWWFHRANGTTF